MAWPGAGYIKLNGRPPCRMTELALPKNCFLTWSSSILLLKPADGVFVRLGAVGPILLVANRMQAPRQGLAPLTQGTRGV